MNTLPMNNLITGRFQLYNASTEEEFEAFEKELFSFKFDRKLVITVFCEFNNKFKYYKTQNTGNNGYIILEDGEWLYE